MAGGKAGPGQQGRPGAISRQQAFALAVQHLRAGQYGKADSLCAKLIAADPLDLNVLHLRSNIAFQAGDPGRAIRMLERVDAISRNDAGVKCDLGVFHLALDHFKQAETYLGEALKLDPKNAGAHLNMGNVQSSQGRLARAETHFRAAIRLQPKMGGAYRNLIETLLRGGKAEDALAVADDLLALAPDSAHGASRKANALARLGRREEAAALFEKALAGQPGDVSARMNYARMLASYGAMDEAVAECRTVLAADSQNVQALVALARFVTFEASDPALAAMAAVLDGGSLKVKDQIGLGFALGKALEDVGDYPGALARIAEAGRINRERLTYSQERSDKLFSDIASAFTAPLFEKFAGAGSDDATPIFVIGMPRSGTSLVEQILSSHPEVAGAGELSAMRQSADRLCEQFGTSEFADAMSRCGVEDLQRMAQDYLQHLRSYSSDAHFIVDKMPGNFVYLGLIRILFPNARIVHCRRDAADNCLSIFKTHFAEGTHGYSYDMAELGHYYRCYNTLMDHWKTLFPDAIHDVVYEDMVADQRGETERLLAFCGLDWSDACMSFFKTSRPVQTASIAQVRRPIYNKSVGLFAKYGPALDRLRVALREG